MRRLACILFLLPLALFGQDISRINGIPIENILLVDSVAPADASRIWSGTPNLGPWWVVEGDTAVYAFQAKGASSITAAKTNLGLSATGITTTGATWSTDYGFICDGVNDMFYINGEFFSTDNTLIFRYSDAVVSSTKQQIAGTSLSGNFYVDIYGTTLAWCNSASCTIADGNTTEGVIAVAGTTAYLNGVAGTGAMNSGTGSASITFGRSSTVYIQANYQAIAIFHKVLSEAQIIEISNRMLGL